jgi:rare lipoprotein A (peptidoglycan hydrolase)
LSPEFGARIELSLPFGVRVTERRTGRSVTVKIVDRGWVIDVSKAAARVCIMR